MVVRTMRRVVSAVHDGWVTSNCVMPPCKTQIVHEQPGLNRFALCRAKTLRRA